MKRVETEGENYAIELSLKELTWILIEIDRVTDNTDRMSKLVELKQCLQMAYFEKESEFVAKRHANICNKKITMQNYNIIVQDERKKTVYLCNIEWDIDNIIEAIEFGLAGYLAIFLSAEEMINIMMEINNCDYPYPQPSELRHAFNHMTKEYLIIEKNRVGFNMRLPTAMAIYLEIEEWEKHRDIPYLLKLKEKIAHAFYCQLAKNNENRD